MKYAILLIAIFFALAAQASRPTSIKYVEEIALSDDSIYAHYQVTCSDGKVADVSAWDKRRKWCVGKGVGEGACEKKQIKIAKLVCKA